MKKKFLSRKFIFTAIADITGLLTMLIGNGTVTTIIGAALMLVATIVFCIVEGTIDAKSVKQISDSAETIAEALGADEKVVDAIDKVGDVVEDLVDEDGGEASVDEGK